MELWVDGGIHLYFRFTPVSVKAGIYEMQKLDLYLPGLALITEGL